MGNPNIAEAGKSTRFGQPAGPDPKGGGTRLAPWSVRKQLRRLMLFPVDLNKPATIEDKLKWLAGPNGKVTDAMILAVYRCEQAKQNWRAMKDLIEAVDGKL